MATINKLDKKVSIVIPVYNERDNLNYLYDSLNNVTRQLSRIKWEYIFVNDGSNDGSLIVLKELAQKNENVVIIDFSRNFGKEVALTAGVHDATSSDAVICIDADLQHPPEVIPKLIDAWLEGALMVSTIRTSTINKSIIRHLSSKIFYKIMSMISDLQMVSQTTDFRLYDRAVIDAFNQATERSRIFRGIMDWLGFDTVYVEFEAKARLSGEEQYNYWSLFRLALNSITSFSLLPLRLAGYLGFLITIFSGCVLLWMLVNFLFIGASGYTPLAIAAVTNTFLSGIILIAIGLVSVYIGNIHTEVLNRPLYVIRSRFSKSEPKRTNFANRI